MGIAITTQIANHIAPHANAMINHIAIRIVSTIDSEIPILSSTGGGILTPYISLMLFIRFLFLPGIAYLLNPSVLALALTRCRATWVRFDSDATCPPNPGIADLYGFSVSALVLARCRATQD